MPLGGEMKELRVVSAAAMGSLVSARWRTSLVHTHSKAAETIRTHIDDVDFDDVADNR